jgi:hypothetical protein
MTAQSVPSGAVLPNDLVTVSRGAHQDRFARPTVPSARALLRSPAALCASSGIGLATAKRFVAKGAYVFNTGRRQSELDAAVKQINNGVTAVQGDVSNLADLDRLYATVAQQKGRIDILFANAGTGEFATSRALSSSSMAA